MTQTIPFFDMTVQNQRLRSELDAAWKEVSTSASFVLGRSVDDFEKEFARYTSTRYAVGVSTGLDALSLALEALGVGAGDEVIVPANTFIATALAVSQCGAKLVLVDADPETLLMNTALVEKALTAKTKAVIPVHLYGQPVDMDSLMCLAAAKKLAIVEDAAQAHGAQWKGVHCGAFGDVGCFSFYPSKNLGAFGDGGLVTTNREELAQKIASLRNYGSSVKYIHEEKGYNRRLDALQAAILKVKLARLEDWNEARVRLAERYDSLLASVPEVRILPKRADARCVYHLYPIRSPRRDDLRQYLDSKGIGTNIHYPVPIHLQKAYADLKVSAGAFPVTEKAAVELLSLPIYPEMNPSDVDQVCEAVRAFYSGKKSNG